GYLPQVRPSFIYMSYVLVIWMMIQVYKRYKKAAQVLTYNLCILIVFIIPFVYSIISNLTYYNQFALLSVDNVFWREVYISNFIGRGIPFAGNPEWMWPPQAYEAWYEYHSPTTPQGRKEMAAKYKDKSFAIINADLTKFITHHTAKLWYVWEKHFLFPYIIGPDSPTIRFGVYWGNVLLLLAGWIGAIVFTIKQYLNKKYKLLTVGALSLFLFAYICASFVFSTSEERFSLPAYPFVILFAGWFINMVTLRLRSRKKK
ncbi:hypothetical protein ACFL1A_03055, partial [Patescibacteria group bacterium]